MSELRPLLECTDDDLERALLGSVGGDAPSSAGLRETALALGLTATTANMLAATLPAATTPLLQAATLPVASSNAATGAVASGASGVATSAGGIAVGALGKSLIGGALVSFLALTTLDHTVGLTTPPTPSTPRAAAAQRRAEAATNAEQTDIAKAAPPDATPPVAETQPSVTSARAASRRPALATDAPELSPTTGNAPTRAAFAPLTTPAAPPAPVSSSLAAEIRLLDQARAALAANDATNAARSLDAYAASRPSAVLAQEAAVLRVQLLVTQGQKPAASALARRIIAQNPQSAHADLLRRLAAEP